MRRSGLTPSPAFRAALAALLLLIRAGGFASPAGPGPPPKEDITLSLKDKVIRDLSSSGLTLAFHIAVSNRSASDRDLVRYHYRVIINQKVFLDMTVGLDAPLPVPAGRDTLLALPVKISYPLLFDAVGPVEDKALCDIVGEMSFADARKREDRVGFAYPGEFPIFKDPEVEFLPIQLNDLTVGGADVIFRTRFKNFNGYDLVVDRLSFRLLFGDKEVLSGAMPGDKSLPRSGEKVFSLPFLIDFFEAGKDLRELLQKAAVPCRLAGEVEITSAWGKLLIRYDKTQDVPVAKTG
ncbi:MAG: LEA type 2 family protein [Candidatus Aminicenantales bacterium]